MAHYNTDVKKHHCNLLDCVETAHEEARGNEDAPFVHNQLVNSIITSQRSARPVTDVILDSEL